MIAVMIANYFVGNISYAMSKLIFITAIHSSCSALTRGPDTQNDTPELRRRVHGQPSGRGSHTSPDGTTLSGEFCDGRAHGNGTRTDAAGCRFEGEFRLGRRDGRGRLFHPGERCHYSGQWLDDRPYGDGAMWFDSCAARFTGSSEDSE